MLGLDIGEETIIVADFEAGTGTLTRLGETRVDAIVVVTDPTVKSLEVASRAADLAAEHTSGPIIIVANRIVDDADRIAVERTLDGHFVLFVPEDDTIPAADRADRAPLDADPDSPAVRALGGLAAVLLAG